MTKAPLVTGVGITSITSAVGVAFSSETTILFDDNEREEQLPNVPQRTSIKREEISIIKENYANLKCVSDLFQGETLEKPTKLGTGNNSLQNDKFEFNKDAKGCLAVWWEREDFVETEATYWKANWNLVWVIKDDWNAIVFFTSLNTEDDVGILYSESFVHKLEKKTNKWSVTANTNESRERTSITNKEEQIIKPGELVQNSGENIWGFDFDLDKICSEERICTNLENGKKKEVSKMWTLVSEEMSDKKLEEQNLYRGWSVNYDCWSDSNYNIFTDYFYIEEYFKNIRGHFKKIT